jgi:hypothetical protein
MFGGAAPPLWDRIGVFGRVYGRRPHYVVWRNALAAAIGSEQVLDQRGIVLGSEEELSRRSRFILGWMRRTLELAETPGWKRGVPDYVGALMTSFFEPTGNRVAWIMVETCRDRIRSRHTRLTEELRDDDSLDYRQPASVLLSRRHELSLDAGLRIPSRHLRFALPEGRNLKQARLVRTDIKRTLWTPSRPEPFGALISCFCLANPGEDDDDLTKGFVPSGLQCRQPSGINAARLITWFRMMPDSGYLENYTIDLDPTTGQLLSLRFQQASLRLAIEMDPWLDDWLRSALRHFPRRLSLGS